jgi:hypothetical protein
MSGNAYTLEENREGWSFVVEGRRSPTYATRRQAAIAAEIEKNERERGMEEELDAGLEGTFPASDPVSVTNPVTVGAPEENKH